MTVLHMYTTWKTTVQQFDLIGDFIFPVVFD